MTNLGSGINMLVRPWFFVLLSVAIVHQLLQKVAKVSQPLLDAYLDPLLFMPILLHLMLWERRSLFGKGPYYTLGFWRTVAIFILVGIITEIVFPSMSSKFTTDVIDVACYAIGSMVFLLIWNKPVAIR